MHACIGEGIFLPGEYSSPGKNIGEYSCLENPRERGAWWAAVYGAAQSQTRLKRLSSSSSGSDGRESACDAGDLVNLWVRKNPWRRKWQSTPVFLPRKLGGQRSLVDYSPWGFKSRTRQWLNHYITTVTTITTAKISAFIMCHSL